MSNVRRQNSHLRSTTSMQPLPDKDVVRYLRLEEDDETAELLLPSSVRYLGAHETQTGTAHFWSYPTSDGIAWVELDASGSLGIARAVPQPVRDVTPLRGEHALRTVRKPRPAPPVERREKPGATAWVPLAALPACHLHQAWYESASFDAAVTHYGAKVIQDRSAGPGTRYFYLQLTSGRYACIESRRDFPQTVIVSLEVNTRRAGKNSGGKVYVRDIEEILKPMGAVFKMPNANLFIGWSTDA